MVVVGRKRENRERRGDQYFVCVRTCVPYQLNMVVGTRVRVRERERKKKARGAEMMMVVDRGGSLGEGAMSSLVWRLRPGCVRCAVCHIQCATFAQNYLLSLLSPNNFSLQTNSLLTNSMLHTHTHTPSLPVTSLSPLHQQLLLPACQPACLV